MSHFNIDPDLWETYSVSKPCSCGGITSGNCNGCCTVSLIISQRMRAPEEVARIKAERQRKEEDDILRQAEEIKMRRGLT